MSGAVREEEKTMSEKDDIAREMEKVDKIFGGPPDHYKQKTMSPEAERLRLRLSGLHGLSGQRIAARVVAELGITEEMVEVVGEMARDCLGDCGDHEYAGHGLGAADALSALLEVANS